MGEKLQREQRISREDELKKKYAREGFSVFATQEGFAYMTDKARKCPVCGNYPIIYPCKDDRSDPPEKYVIMCWSGINGERGTGCNLRARGTHSPEDCVKWWNAGRYTEASMTICEKPEDINIKGARMMVAAAARTAVLDIMRWMKKQWKLLEEMTEYRTGTVEYNDVKKERDRICRDINQAVTFLVDIGASGSNQLDKIKKVLYPYAGRAEREEMGRRFDRMPEPGEMKALLELKTNEDRKGGYGMAEVKARTKRMYTEYVGHMVRFFFSEENGLKLDGKKKYSSVDIENWCFVQGVFNALTDDEKDAIRFFYEKDASIVDQVRKWAEKSGTDVENAWALLHRFNKQVARTKRLI